MKKRYTEEQNIGYLREVDAGMPIKELCRNYGFSEASYYGQHATLPTHLSPRSQCATIVLSYLESFL
jgi:hypothetical protein